MKKLFKQAAIFTFIFAVAAVVSGDAMAQSYNAGSNLLGDFTGTMKGTMGTTIGLVVSLFGLYMWVWNQATWGIMIAVAGALLTGFPGIYDSIAKGAANSFNKTIGTNNVDKGAPGTGGASS